MTHGILDDPSKVRWRRSVDTLPQAWRQKWESSLHLPVRSEDGIIGMIGAIVSGVSDGTIDLDLAGLLLHPLYSHPHSWTWTDGELVAIAVASDTIQMPYPRGEREDSWRDIQDCYRRLVLSGVRV